MSRWRGDVWSKTEKSRWTGWGGLFQAEERTDGRIQRGGGGSGLLLPLFVCPRALQVIVLSNPLLSLGPELASMGRFLKKLKWRRMYVPRWVLWQWRSKFLGCPDHASLTIWEITAQAAMFGLSISGLKETLGEKQKCSPPLTPWLLSGVAASVTRRLVY